MLKDCRNCLVVLDRDHWYTTFTYRNKIGHEQNLFAASAAHEVRRSVGCVVTACIYVLLIQRIRFQRRV